MLDAKYQNMLYEFVPKEIFTVKLVQLVSIHKYQHNQKYVTSSKVTSKIMISTRCYSVSQNIHISLEDAPKQLLHSIDATV